MPSVLFVCTGNICRSAYAERIARSISDGSWTYASAGTMALLDAPMDPPMAALLRAAGGDPDGFASRQLTGRLLAAADLVVCMSRNHRAWAVEESPAAARRSVLLTRFVDAIEEHPGMHGTDLVRAVLTGPSIRAADIADPYRRGEQAARQAAESIGSSVRRLVAALEGQPRITA